MSDIVVVKMLSIGSYILQQEKEALDDLATELELADEDRPVLYVDDYAPMVLI